MPAGICLPPKTIEAFKRALVSGKINPERLSSMNSAERRELFNEIVGEGNSKFVNAQFESKLLLKNQQAGYLRWAKKIAGITPEAKRDIISRISKLDRVLDPGEEKQFLHDLASTKLGVDVSAGEAKQIANMSQKIRELEVQRKADGTFPSETARMQYGYAVYDMSQYLNDLKLAAEKGSLADLALHPLETTAKLGGIAKSVKAALDDSALFRQGWKTLWTNPKIWSKNAARSFNTLYQSGIRNKDVVRETMADIISRPNYPKYQKMKLAVGNIEESYPTSLPEKIPVAGRLFKASEQAYEAFLYRTRADVADKLLTVAERTGVNVNDGDELKSVGKLINALTGRGDLGRFENGEAAKTFNNLFFSIRFVKSNFDTLTAHLTDKHMSTFARKQAAGNLLKVVAGTAAVMAIADRLMPGSVSFDPRSKDFGKVKVGHTRFDLTGGMGSLATLAAQIATNSEKSTSTGIISKFNNGFGAKTGMDALNNFFENKLSPIANFGKDLINRKDGAGNPVTWHGELNNFITPLPISNTVQTATDPHAAPWVWTMIADGLGISANTYGGSQKNFTTGMAQSATLTKFHDAVGEQKFKAANKSYNQQVDQWMAQHQAELLKLAPDEQQTTLNSVKTKIQNRVYKQYDFKLPKSKPTGARKSLLDSVK